MLEEMQKRTFGDTSLIVSPALRYVLSLPGVHACLTGTTGVQHLRRNVEITQAGPLPQAIKSLVRSVYERFGHTWPAMI